MPKPQKEWKYNFNSNYSLYAELSQELGISSKIASLLDARGISDKDAMKKFLFGGLEYLHNPFLFNGMDKAADRIRKAIDLREQILVYGDRDVDGITSVNIVVNTLKLLGANIWWYVPADEGYKVHKDILTQYAQENVKLLITVDCGIAAKEEIDYAVTLGMDVIVTDHHEPINGGMPRNITAVIDSKLPNTPYPFKDIAGCVVALKTVQAAAKTFDREYNKNNLLFLFKEKEGQAEGLQSDCGDFALIKNDLIVQSGSFASLDELKKLIRESFRVYTYNSPSLSELLKKDILLKDKICIFENSKKYSIDDLFFSKIALSNRDGRMKDFFENNLDLCALGVIADSMPLIDENKIIVREGLKVIESNPHSRPGLGLLIEDSLKTKDSYNITAHSVSWNVTPVLNSAGRLGRGMLSVQLLMTKDSYQAQNLYADIIKLNGERKDIQLENTGQFKYLLKEQYDAENDKAIIVTASNLEHGVTGIIASLMLKEYSKPAFLLISDGNEAVGAARASDNFSIINALENAKHLLEKYGGHSQAAGFTIKHSNIAEFKKITLEYAGRCLPDAEPKNIISIDGELKISDINFDFFKQIESLAPFGMGNARPIFCIRGANITEISTFGIKEEHIKFKVSQNGSRNVPAVFWNHSKLCDFLKKEKFVDIAFYLESAVDRNGDPIIQLIIADVQEAA